MDSKEKFMQLIAGQKSNALLNAESRIAESTGQAEGEKTLREIQEAKSHIEYQVSELIKGFTKKFPQVEIHLKVETSYMDIKTTKLETEKRFCKVDVKAYVTV